MCCFNPTLPVSNQDRNTEVVENTLHMHIYGQELSLHGLWLCFTMLLAKLEDHWFGKETKVRQRVKSIKLLRLF